MPEFDSTIEYRQVPEYPGYAAGSDGSVWSCLKSSDRNTWVELFLYREKKRGRPIFQPYVNGIQQHFQVGRFILLAFVGPCPEGMECCHGNDMPWDNRTCNLRWDTPASNVIDRYINDRNIIGEDSPSAKLTEEMVVEARMLSSQGTTNKDLAKRFGIDTGQMSRIIGGSRWAHLPGSIQEDRRFGATHMNQKRQCRCGKEIVGPSYFRHIKACRSVGLLRK